MAKDFSSLFSAKSLIKELKIPDKYLRRLITDLSKGGFIMSVQGRVGGYKFLKPISQIRLSEIIDAVEGMDKYSGCILGFNKCSQENPCVLHNSIAAARDEFLEKLYTTT